MTTTVDEIRLLVAGQPENEHALLNTCRLEASSNEIIGHRSIGEFFRCAPFAIDAQAHQVEKNGCTAIFDVDAKGQPLAFFADTFSGRIQRLWRIGPGVPMSIQTEPAISVPFDPRMSQLAPNIAFTESDHPDLDKLAIPRLHEVVQQLCSDDSVANPQSSARRSAFVIRAISDQDKCAALIQLHELATGPVRRSRFRLAAIFFRFAGDELVQSISVVDVQSDDTNWTPRVPAPHVENTPNPTDS